MSYIIYKTGHQIADTVADACRASATEAILSNTHQPLGYGTPVGYGILRGMDTVFKQARQYVHLDRGYWKPGHYDGYYRVSLNGTQQTKDWPEPDYDRWDALQIPLKPWRGHDHSKPVLVVPPTDAVAEYFKKKWAWDQIVARCTDGISYPPDPVVRHKNDPNPINFDDYNSVLTFNSSLGWQAIAAGIPCMSDTTHSMIGSWYHNISLDDLSEAQYSDRRELFATMSGLQMTLDEIRQGKLWGLMSRLMSSSDLIAEKLSELM